MKILHNFSINNFNEEFIFCEEIENGKQNVFNFYTGAVKTIDRNSPVPEGFVMRIPNGMAMEIIKGMAKKIGIGKTENENKTEGKLEATKYHLEDLRTLLKVNREGGQNE